MFFIYFLITILGIIIGSFINCILYRLEKNESFIKGRSYCPKCKHSLLWKELIPLISWLFLKGKCSYCRKKISIKYPIIEAITGFLFLITTIFVINNYPEFYLFFLIFYLTIVFSFLIIFFFDLKHFLVSELVILYTSIFVVLWSIIAFILEIKTLDTLLIHLLAAVFSALFFYLLYILTKKKGIGFGDIQIIFLLGLIAGFPNILFIIFFASFFGSIVGIFLILFYNKGLKTPLPFGSFLVVLALVALFYSNLIAEIYDKFFFIL